MEHWFTKLKQEFYHFRSSLEDNPKRKQLVINFVILLALLLTVGAVMTVQNLKQRASGSENLKILNSSGTVISQTTDQNVQLQITLPSDWQLPTQSRNNNFIPKAYASHHGPDFVFSGANCTNEDVTTACDSSHQWCWDGACHVNNCPYPNTSGQSSCSSNSQCASGWCNAECCSAPPAAIEPTVPVFVPPTAIPTVTPRPQPEAGQPLAETATPILQPTTPQATQTPTTHILQSITIENKDNGSGGTQIPPITGSDIQRVLTQGVQWKLNDLNPNETEAERVVQVTLFDGTNYVPFVTKITLKREVVPSPNARIVDPNNSLNEYDNPPALIASTITGARSLLTNAGSAAGYQIKINESENETTLEFEANELTEAQAKLQLQRTDFFYLRMLMYILYDPFNAIDGSPIDARYALCDHLSEDTLNKIGAEPTTLIGEDYRELDCSDNPPTLEQLGIGNSHNGFEYRKIPATILLKMIETAKLSREEGPQIDLKIVQLNAKDFAFNMIPFLGPTINAMRHPGSDPYEVAQESLIAALLQVIGGKVTEGGVYVVKSVASPIISSIRASAVAIFVREGTEEVLANAAPVVQRVATQFRNHQQVGIILKDVGLLVKKINFMKEHEQFVYNQLKPLLGSGIANVLDPNTSRPIMQGVITRVEYLYARAGILHRFDKKAIMDTIENNWVVVVDDDYYDLYFKVGNFTSLGFSRERLVVVRRSASNDLETLVHEFIHVISFNDKLLPMRVGRFFKYDREQAGVYGAAMSQIYELFTEELTIQLSSGKQINNYASHFPQIYNSLNSFIDKLIVHTRGIVTRDDFYLFALTGDDQLLMQKLLDNGVSPDLFMNYLGKTIDGEKLVKILADYRRNLIQDVAKKPNNHSWIVPAGLIGGAVYSAIFAKAAFGEELPNDAPIIYEHLDKDADISLPDNTDSLNCSYSEAKDTCSDGFQVCTGFTTDSQCQGKNPNECFNRGLCNYDQNKDSSCVCNDVYKQFANCFKQKSDTDSCLNKGAFDFDKDGDVDEQDYKLFLQSLGQ